MEKYGANEQLRIRKKNIDETRAIWQTIRKRNSPKESHMSPFNKNLTPINGRLVAYATLAGAALAAPAIPSADATIVYSGIVNFSIPNNFDGLYIDFVTGATGTSSAAVPGANFNPYNGGTGLQFFWNAAQNGGLSLDTTTYATL